ncbi:hypothetical protein FHQ18_11700 [Deferribacter autotrophicus]|uniref:Uncharacterized protein n=1 Tax=Deferribacter autotrophicus TaxID=500465 RepID=A0A5A8F094_9BACT|nr:3TM-type holin [Deferribacter autotrophicus]KAA0257222.1 hypothetical protein FHQ18_11700 [Deferribacter autotrophicus]
MPILATLLPAAISAVKGLLKEKSPELANAVEKIIETPEAKLKLEELAIEKLKLEQNIEKWELEDRQSARELAKVDMASDSWLSKNVRPLILIFLTGMFVVAFFMSSQNKYEMEMINTFKSLLAWVYTFYFGGRSVEKVIKILKG